MPPLNQVVLAHILECGDGEREEALSDTRRTIHMSSKLTEVAISLMDERFRFVPVTLQLPVPHLFTTAKLQLPRLVRMVRPLVLRRRLISRRPIVPWQYQRISGSFQRQQNPYPSAIVWISTLVPLSGAFFD